MLITGPNYVVQISLKFSRNLKDVLSGFNLNLVIVVVYEKIKSIKLMLLPTLQHVGQRGLET